MSVASIGGEVIDPDLWRQQVGVRGNSHYDLTCNLARRRIVVPFQREVGRQAVRGICQDENSGTIPAGNGAPGVRKEALN